MSEVRPNSPPPITLVPKPQAAPPAHPFFGHPWLIGSLSALVVIAAIAIIWWSLSSGGTVRYTTAAVTRGAVTRAVTATGTVNPVLTIIVGSYVSGVIQELSCDYNTEVKGPGLRQDRPAPLSDAWSIRTGQSRGAPRRSSRRTRRASPTRRLTYDRSARLAQTNAISKDTLDNAKNALDQAQAQIGVDQATIAQRQAQLAAAQVNLDYTNIISPVNGTVVSRNVNVGQTVAASFQTPTLFLIATDLTKMQVDTNVSESDIGGVKDGDKANFTVEAYPEAHRSRAPSRRCASRRRHVQNVVTYDVVVERRQHAISRSSPGMTATTPDRHRPSATTCCGCRARRCGTRPQRHTHTARRRTRRHASARRRRRVWVLRDGKPVRVAGRRSASTTTPIAEIVGGDAEARRRVIIAEQRRQRRTRPAPRPACRARGCSDVNAMAEPSSRLDTSTRTYHVGDVDVHALRGVSLTIERGEFVAIMGASGLGQVDADGDHRLPRSAEQRPLLLRRRRRRRLERAGARAHPQRAARLRVPELQSAARAPARWRTSRCRCSMPRPGRSSAARDRRGPARRCGLLGLGDRERNTPGQLSGGQQQRVAIARALINEPGLLLADEPTGNLDTRTSHEIMETLTTLNREQGVTIVVVTHEADIAAYADRVVTMRDGADRLRRAQRRQPATRRQAGDGRCRLRPPPHGRRCSRVPRSGPSR